MGFRQRERRRRNRAAAELAQAHARTNGTSADKWWLTPAETKTCCATCGHILTPGRDMVYRHQPCEVRCVPCADRDPACTYRPSIRWEREQAKRRQGRLL